MVELPNHRLNLLQSIYDRKVTYRTRLVRIYDECADGDPLKDQVLSSLAVLGREIREVEQAMVNLLEP